jgi:AbrB family looped-hinge helix DNA binding protein
MRLRLDASGRLTLPKSVRRRFGLRAGEMIEASDSEEGIFLRPIKPSSLVRENGFWVHTGKMADGFDSQRLLSDLREERLRKILGTTDPAEE